MIKNKSALKRQRKQAQRKASQQKRLDRLNAIKVKGSAPELFMKSYEIAMETAKDFYLTFTKLNESRLVFKEADTAVKEITERMDYLTRYYEHSSTLLRRHDFSTVNTFERDYCLGVDTNGEFQDITTKFGEFLDIIERLPELKEKMLTMIAQAQEKCDE